MNASSDVEDEDFSRSTINLKQSNSFGNLTDSTRNAIDTTTMKRNKSFWRFSKSEDVLEGMALWKHRDLVPIDDKELTLKKLDKPVKKGELAQKKESQENSRKVDTLKSNKRDSSNSKNQNFNNFKDVNKNGNFSHRNNDYPDDIYDETNKRRNDMGPPKAHSQKAKYEKGKNNNEQFSREIQDTNFYDEDDVMVIKTVKRKEILRQYYSSGTDTELSSSDPYDCIVVDPTTSTFRKRNTAGEADMRGSVSGTLLPRTKLTKASRNDAGDHLDTNERMNTAKSNRNLNKNNFGPWSNLWPDE